MWDEACGIQEIPAITVRLQDSRRGGQHPPSAEHLLLMEVTVQWHQAPSKWLKPDVTLTTPRIMFAPPPRTLQLSSKPPTCLGQPGHVFFYWPWRNVSWRILCFTMWDAQINIHRVHRVLSWGPAGGSICCLNGRKCPLGTPGRFLKPPG